MKTLLHLLLEVLPYVFYTVLIAVCSLVVLDLAMEQLEAVERRLTSIEQRLTFMSTQHDIHRHEALYGRPCAPWGWQTPVHGKQQQQAPIPQMPQPCGTIEH